MFSLFIVHLFPNRYVQALADRVTVIFSTTFKDPDDLLIGKVFMQVCVFIFFSPVH